MGTRLHSDPRAATPVDARLGARVRELRLEREISQTELADKIGVTFQQIQKYEKGLNRIAVATLLRISDAFGVPAAALLEGIQATPSRQSQNQAEIEELNAAAARLNGKGLTLLLSMARTLSKDKSLMMTRAKR